VLFAGLGLAFLVLFLHGLTGPDFQHPVTVSDWFATLGFSAVLFGLAAALLMFGRMFGDSRIRRVSFVPGIGAALGGADRDQAAAGRIGPPARVPRAHHRGAPRSIDRA